MKKIFTIWLTVMVTAFIIAGCKKKEQEPMGIGDISMRLPYSSSSDIGMYTNGFSATTNAPWGFVHNGIDLIPSTNLLPFHAAASGKVVELRLWRNDISLKWQVNVSIQYNSTYTGAYTFETFSTNQSDGQTQLNNIPLSLGRFVSQGDLIGKLLMVGSGAHLHFGLIKNETAICPEPYLTTEARNSLLDMIHHFHPTWNICAE